MAEGRPLKILHVLRSPVGGLFRHVVDLTRGQIAHGHLVGIIADATTGGERADRLFAELAPDLALGLTRVAMSRDLGPSDFLAWHHVAHRLDQTGADVIHGHGAKGGAYARLTATRAIRVYTPHGGSLHYSRSSPVGFLYLSLEQALKRRTDLILFESAYAESVFRAKIGVPSGIVRVVHNGVTAAEFAPVEPAPVATDLVFIGELRMLKGVDVLIDAMAALARTGRTVTATLVGEGPDGDALKARAETAGLMLATRFVGAHPARIAFALGQVVVVPSRAESLPYIVLEAAAAGRPIITTAVGGIPEIFGPASHDLVPPGDPEALGRAIVATLDDPAGRRKKALALQARVKSEFSVEKMLDGVVSAYRDTLKFRISH